MKRRTSVVSLLGRTGDLIVAAVANRQEPGCSTTHRCWIADQIEGRLGTMNDHERERLLSLVSELLGGGDHLATSNNASSHDLLITCLAMVDHVIDRARDPFEMDLRTGHGRIKLMLDWDDRRRGCACVHFIKVRSGSACSTIAHARLQGSLHRIGGEDLVLTADEWKWLYGHEVSLAVRHESFRLW